MVRCAAGLLINRGGGLTARIHRGFHRIGVVLAMPVLAWSALIAFNEHQRPTGPERGSTEFPSGPFKALTAHMEDGRTLSVKGTDQARVTAAIEAFQADEARARRKFTADSGEYTRGDVSIRVLGSDEARKYGRESDFGFSLMVLTFALAIYSVARAVGWIVSGFTPAEAKR